MTSFAVFPEDNDKYTSRRIEFIDTIIMERPDLLKPLNPDTFALALKLTEGVDISYKKK